MAIEFGPKYRSNGLFRGDFSAVELNACVGDNGGRYDLFDYAHGYFAATKKILAAADHQGMGVAVDTLVYPACYNFRHSIELFVKYLVAAYAELLDAPNLKFQTNHSLQNNWETALTAARKIAVIPDEDRVQIISDTIKDFSEIDPKGIIFRYPDGIKGEQHLKEWSLINLGIVRRRADLVFEIFTTWQLEIEAQF